VADFVEPSLLVPTLRNDLGMRALETLSARVSGLSLAPTVVYDFDHVEVSALIHLAEQFNVLGDAGWDMASAGASPEAKKRALLKTAVALHRIKGTPYAVQRALELLGVNATLTEWFQAVPQGDPYTFRLDAQVTEQPAGAPAIDATRAEQIKRVVSFWKPASRHFSLRLGLGMTTGLRVAAVFSGTQCLNTQGAMLPLDVAATSGLRSASLFSGAQLLVSSGSIH
jgi:phage tail P2-like protein